jgi:thioredoxin 1
VKNNPETPPDFLFSPVQHIRTLYSPCHNTWKWIFWGIHKENMMVEKNLPKSFDELIKTSTKPVLVDFYADWCGPCKMVSPLIKRIAQEYSGKLLTIKINIDNKQHIAVRYNINSVPTIMMFFKGKELMRLQGAHPYDTIKSNIELFWPE